MAGASAAKLTPVDNDVAALPSLFGGSDRSSIVDVVRHSKVTWQHPVNIRRYYHNHHLKVSLSF